MNEATTLDTQLNVLGKFDGSIPESFVDSRYVFLANGPPGVQHRILYQIKKPKLVVADTMNLDTRRKRRAGPAARASRRSRHERPGSAGLHGDCEPPARRSTLILQTGPRFAVIKKGEHGALLVTKDKFFAPSAAFRARRSWTRPARATARRRNDGYLARVDKTSVAES